MSDNTSPAPAKPRGRKPRLDPANPLGNRLKFLRQQAGLSQEALGAQGFVSTPGWIKIENGQRSPSEKLIGKVVSFMVEDGHVKGRHEGVLREELLTLKYLGCKSPFVRELAREHAKSQGVPTVAQ